MLLLTALVAAVGPALAPRDPGELNYVFNVGGRFTRPPLPAFVADGFPLGSDRLGRDTLSQTDRPLWEIELPGRRGIVGGALTGGQLLLATADGKLFSLGM